MEFFYPPVSHVVPGVPHEAIARFVKGTGEGRHREDRAAAAFGQPRLHERGRSRARHLGHVHEQHGWHRVGHPEGQPRQALRVHHHGRTHAGAHRLPRDQERQARRSELRSRHPASGVR